MVTSQAAAVPATRVDLLPDDLSAVVVLPTYNEVENIPAILRGILAAHPAVEVLVVDDNSPDGTADATLRVAGTHPNRVHLLCREGKAGLGAAYRAGFAWALERGYEIIVQMDADGSHPADRLPALLAAISLDVADMAIGSRYVEGGGTCNWPLSRRLLSRSGNLYARTALGLSQRDLTGGFRAWRRETLIAADPGGMTTTGYGFLVELAMAAHTAGARVMELPITFVDRVYGDSKMSRAIAVEGMRMVWRLRKTSRRARPALALGA